MHIHSPNPVIRRLISDQFLPFISAANYSLAAQARKLSSTMANWRAEFECAVTRRAKN
jgi:hypothetical protein